MGVDGEDERASSSPLIARRARRRYEPDMISDWRVRDEGVGVESEVAVALVFIWLFGFDGKGGTTPIYAKGM